MDKALAILEKHVQWIAIGIGALFLVFMVYSYALQDPVTVTVPGQSKPLTPAQLDKSIYESPELASLREGMKTGKARNVVLPQIKDLQIVFTDILKPVQLVGTGDTGTQNGPKTPTPPVATANQFATLILTKAEYVANMIGRAQVTWQKAQPPPPAGAPVDPAVPVPPPPIVAAPLAPQIEVRDVDYASCLFKLKVVDLEQAMRKAGIDPLKHPELARRFQFLGVEIERLEQMPDGRWVAKPTIIGPLPPYQEGWKDLPRNDDPDQGKKFAYAEWAALNVRTILQPAFPQVTYGQPWGEPGQPLPPKIEAPVDFQQPPPGFVPPGVVPPAVPPGIRRPPIGRQPEAAAPALVDENGYVLVSAPLRGDPRYPSPSPYTPRPVTPGAPYVPPVSPEGAPVDPGAGVTAQAGFIPGEGAEEGLFNPADIVTAYKAAGQEAEVKIYAHDITVKPSMTYRYRVRYFMRNPFWKAPGMQSVDPQITSYFVISSPFSEWSTPVTIPARVEIFAADWDKTKGEKVLTDAMKFNVFAFKDAAWKHTAIVVTAGDPVATADGNSGWTVVDVRKNPKDQKAYSTLVDANGKLERHDPLKDDTTRHKELLALTGMLPPAPLPGDAPPIPGVPGVPGAGRRPPAGQFSE